MAIERALIVEDSASILRSLTEFLKEKKCEVATAEKGEQGLQLLQQYPFDLLFCRMKMAHTSEKELLQTAKEHNPNIIVIFTTSVEHVDEAIETIRWGAFNYLIHPFSPDVLETILEKAQEHVALVQENHYLRHEISAHSEKRREQIIAESAMMKQILQDILKIAKSNASVFISGESGTGKEVIAHAIHFQSARAQAPFVKVNCAAIPEPLIESEFFGHEKGAFTGAINKRPGRFELADKGTLLLDEISEIPLALQSKLLRAVQEQEFERVGGIKTLRVDVRFLSTSNRNMKEAIEQKLFREDLYYRLNVVPLHLPALRERREDILPLAEYFLERLCMENHKPRKRLSQESRKKLLDYPWPGNIRELANIIERTVVMNAATFIEPEHLCLDSTRCRTEIPTSSYESISLEELEKQHILKTLAAQKNNRTKTAALLGISIRTLRNKLNQYTQRT